MRLVLIAGLLLVVAFQVSGCRETEANPVVVTEHEVLVTDNNYDDVVAKSSLPVLLDFATSWCPPCRQMAPLIQRIAAERDGQLVVGIVDGDRKDTARLQMGFRVSGYPTFVVVIDGKPVASISGGANETEFRAWLDKHTGSAN